MFKIKFTGFLKFSYEIILVILQFLIIILHFVKLKFFPNIQIMMANSIFSFIGILIILIASIVMLKAIIDLGGNLSPLPKPIAKGNLITSGVYRFMRHPMYYSLILISFGFFIINFSFYYLCLTISLTLLIKLKIILEEQYLNKKFKKYFLYKEKVKY